MSMCCLHAQNQGHPGQLRGEFTIDKSSWQTKRWMAFSSVTQPQTQNFIHYSLFNSPGCRAFPPPSDKSPQLVQPWLFVFLAQGAEGTQSSSSQRFVRTSVEISHSVDGFPHFCLLRELEQYHSADTVLFIAWDNGWQSVKPKGGTA